MASAVAAAMIPIGVTAGSAVDEAALAGAGAAAVVGSLLDMAEALQDPLTALGRRAMALLAYLLCTLLVQMFCAC